MTTTCKSCNQPMLPPGTRRKNVHDYRHARGCPEASARERKATERLWQEAESACK